VLIKGLEGHSH